MCREVTSVSKEGAAVNNPNYQRELESAAKLMQEIVKHGESEKEVKHGVQPGIQSRG
jgi:hypothetical protein